MSKSQDPRLKNDKLIFEMIADPNYRIHEDGKIETLVQLNGKVGTTWREAGGSQTPDGYRVIRFRGVGLRIHRIIWAKFYGILGSKLVINHKDGVKFNNAFSNLEMITEAENQIHAYRIGCKNVQRGNAKLSWSTVNEIRDDRKNGYTLKKLQEKYSLPKTTLSYVCSGKTYREELKDGSN